MPLLETTGLAMRLSSANVVVGAADLLPAGVGANNCWLTPCPALRKGVVVGQQIDWFTHREATRLGHRHLTAETEGTGRNSGERGWGRASVGSVGGTGSCVGGGLLTS